MNQTEDLTKLLAYERKLNQNLRDKAKSDAEIIRAAESEIFRLRQRLDFEVTQHNITINERNKLRGLK